MLSYKTRARGKHRLKALFNLKTLIATVLGGIILALLLSFSDISKVLQIIARFPLWAIPVLFGLFLGREILRAMEWRLFLNAIGLHASRRAAFLTLTGGDAAQILPGGLYFEDLLISRELDTSLGAPLGATTLTIWMEVTVSMLALALLGLPGIPLLRPVMAFCGVGSLVVLLLLHTHLLGLLQGLVRHLERKWHRGRKLVGGLNHFVDSFAGLSHPKVILSGLLLCAAYLALTIYGFYLVCVNLHLTVGIADATAIYSLVLAVVDINPLPSDLGVSELSGVGGFLAYHQSAAAGLAAMLTFRISLLICEEVVAAGTFLLFHQETKRIFRSRPSPPSAETRDPLP